MTEAESNADVHFGVGGFAAVSLGSVVSFSGKARSNAMVAQAVAVVEMNWSFS